jgi:hypothetical protein
MFYLKKERREEQKEETTAKNKVDKLGEQADLWNLAIVCSLR